MGARPTPGTFEEAVRDLRAEVDNPAPPSDTVTLVVSHVDVEAVLDELDYLQEVEAAARAVVEGARSIEGYEDEPPRRALLDPLDVLREVLAQ